jgi:hypothetical protein
MSTISNFLTGVAVTSNCKAWAVGHHHTAGADRDLILHWNGSAWKVQAYRGAFGLNGVAAASAHNAWAVGWSRIEHWNGAVWTRQKSPAGQLQGVAALSPTSAWAVGFSSKSINPFYTQILHWNGKAWKVQPSPNPGGPVQNNVLNGVAATSSSDAWAVGEHDNDTGGDAATGIRYWTVVEHWNGRAWKAQKTPNIGGLRGVAATSRTNAWAVGDGGILHWNGKAWKLQNTPNPGTPGGVITGVATNSPTNVWAVGDYFAGSHPTMRNLALHWNGTVWGP